MYASGTGNCRHPLYFLGWGNGRRQTPAMTACDGSSGGEGSPEAPLPASIPAGSICRTSSGFRAVFGKSLPVKVTPIRLRVLGALGVGSVKGFRLNLAPSTTGTATQAKGCAPAAEAPAAAAADAAAFLAVPWDVAEEQLRVAEVADYAAYPLVIRGLHKVYPAQDGQQPKVRRTGEGTGVDAHQSCFPSAADEGGVMSGCWLGWYRCMQHAQQKVQPTMLACVVLQVAVRRLDLAVAQGECFGLLGPNGAGKSSSIAMLVGLQEPTAGTAIIGGCSVLRHARGWVAAASAETCKPPALVYMVSSSSGTVC